MKTFEFDAIMLSDGTYDWGYVEFPYDVQKEFGTKGQVKVAASFDGYQYCGSLVKMGRECHFFGITKPIRAAIGKNPGDRVHVIIRRDTEPRTVEVSTDLSLLLQSHPEAEVMFNTLSYSNRKAWVQWITSSKKEETRQRRLIGAIEKLLMGIKEPLGRR
jgi:hypothetical protein